MEHTHLIERLRAGNRSYLSGEFAGDVSADAREKTAACGQHPKAIVIVSHDRMFMDKIVSEVYEFEFGRLNHYSGNYSSYVEQKKVQFEKQQSAYRRQQAEIERLTAQIEKFRYKKEKAAFAQSKIKYLERMERIEKPR